MLRKSVFLSEKEGGGFAARIGSKAGIFVILWEIHNYTVDISNICDETNPKIRIM